MRWRERPISGQGATVQEQHQLRGDPADKGVSGDNFNQAVLPQVRPGSVRQQLLSDDFEIAPTLVGSVPTACKP